MNRYRVIVVLTVTACLLALGLPAKACSCYRGDPYEAFANSDGAFIGEFVSSYDPDPPEPGEYYSSGDPIIYTFRVEEAAKGEFGDTVDVEAARDGASCGLEVSPGESYGLLLYQTESGGWGSGLCSQMTPEDLRYSARGLPEPDGEGPIKMLVGGSFGPATTIALDEQGRTLSYGYGEGDAAHLSVCPESERFVEVATMSEQKPHLVVRDTASMEKVSETELPLGEGFRGQQPRGVLCRNADASEAIVLSLSYNTRHPNGTIWSVTDGVVKKLYAGTGRNFDIVGDRVFMREGKKGRLVSYFDLDKGSRARVASVTRKAGLSVSPNGKNVAGVSGSDPSRLTIADLSGSKRKPKDRVLGSYAQGDIVWIDNRTFVLLPGGDRDSKIRVFNANLKETEDVPGQWYTLANVLVGDRVWGVGWGGLYQAQLTEGPAELLRYLPTEVTNTLAPVVDEVHAVAE
ncbi:MAG TPA: hypothetical protein VE174_11460 [Actinomycetota bacterium]|nr:hypothetical protein [Actinomycetota bacterium]